MNWLDGYIDRMYERESLRKRPAWFGTVPPQFTPPGSIFNAAGSSALVALRIWFGATQKPFGFGFIIAPIGLAIAVVFVRIAVRVSRGDFTSS